MEDPNKDTLPDSLRKTLIGFGDICRFCLTETKDGISVHDKCLSKESEGLELESVYNFITKLGIIKERNSENFPLQMCKNCYELIKLFHNFSQVCQKSDNLLRECYQSVLKETESRLNSKTIEKIEIKAPQLKGLNFLSVNLPQASQCAIRNSIESNQKTNSSTNVNEEYKDNLNSLSDETEKPQSNLTEMFPTTSGSVESGEFVPATRNEKTTYTCSQCSLQFINPRALNFHYAAAHSQTGAKTVFKFQCINCRKSFTHLERLKRHYKIIHRISESDLTEAYLNKRVKHSVETEKINFFCFQCAPYKQFQTRKGLVEHLADSHKMKQTKGSPTLYSCAHCPYAIFVTRLTVNEHLFRVHNLKEDEITWNDVKCVSIAHKPQMTANSPKVLICLNPPPFSESQQKSKDTLPTDRLPIDDRPDRISGSASPCDLPSTFDSESNAPVHWTEATKDDSSWNCPECPASYSRKQSLHCHMREKHNHVSPGATKCPECSETFLTNRRLIQHGISVHEKYFAYFHQVFKKVLQPAREEEEEDREKNFECDVCSKKYIYKTSLRKHILSAHLGKSRKEVVTCSYCGKTLSNKLNLRSHIEFVHEALFVSCPICKKKINFRTIGRHYKTHRANADGVYPGNNFLCNLCGKVLKSKRSFEDHQKLHKNIRDEICDVCGSGFTTKKLLRLHKKTHEGVARKLFACDKCEKVFSGRHTLNRHLLTHSGKKNFICEICSKCFYTIQELNRHVRYHKKDYKFDCQLCDMRFLCKSRFRHHMMKHRNVRPHKCQFCEKMFIERAKMNLHMSTKHNVEVQNKKAVWKDPKTYVPLDDLL